MKEKRWFPIVYMFVATAFFSSIVIAFAQVTNERVRANQALALEKSVLAVLPGISIEGLSSPQLHQKFVDEVSKPDASSGGAYTLGKGGDIKGYAVPIEGKGFWAMIKGVIGVEADRKTITGIYFYEQNETPGLGAEIAKEDFRAQFKGKVISGRDKTLNMKRPGAELGDSDVHAVTGATQTSTRLEKIINDGLKEWRSKMGASSAQ